MNMNQLLAITLPLFSFFFVFFVFCFLLFFFCKDRYDEEEKKLVAFCWFSPLLLHFFPTPMYLGQYLRIVGLQIRL